MLVVGTNENPLSGRKSEPVRRGERGRGLVVGREGGYERMKMKPKRERTAVAEFANLGYLCVR